MIPLNQQVSTFYSSSNWPTAAYSFTIIFYYNEFQLEFLMFPWCNLIKVLIDRLVFLEPSFKKLSGDDFFMEQPHRRSLQIRGPHRHIDHTFSDSRAFLRQILADSSSTTSQVQAHSSSESQQVAHSSSESQQVAHSSSESQQVAHSSSESQQVVHSSTESQQVVHSSTESQQVAHSSSQSQQVAHSSPESQQVAHSSTESQQVVHSSPESQLVLKYQRSDISRLKSPY